MAEYQTVETEQIAATSSSKAAEFEGGVQRVYITADADCYVDFDQPAVTSRSYLVDVSAGSHLEFDFGKSSVKSVTAITGGGSANVYIVAVRE